MERGWSRVNMVDCVYGGETFGNGFTFYRLTFLEDFPG